MAKTLRIVAALLIIFIACYMGAHYWIRWKNTVHDDVTKLSRLAECEPNNVREISIVQENEGKAEELKFARVDEPAAGMPSAVAYGEAEWKYVSPLAGEADATIVRRIASTLCELYDPVLLRADEMERASPSARRAAKKLVFTLVEKGEPKTIHVEFGAAREDRMSTVLFSVEGKEKVARIPERFQQVSSLAPAEFQNMQLMRMTADNVQAATLRFENKERFTLERAGAGWSVLVNGQQKGEASEEAGKFVNRLATLRGVEVLEPAYPAERCRSGEAKAVVELKGVAGRLETLRFDFGRGGDIAACSTERSVKLRVHRDLLKYLDLQPRQLIGGLPAQKSR